MDQHDFSPGHVHSLRLHGDDLRRGHYVDNLLRLYLALPDTPMRIQAGDVRRAQHWQEQGVPWELAEAALHLASLRRLLRPPSPLGTLGRIRSLAYFQPVIEELQAQPPQPGYLDYLRYKLAILAEPRP